MKITYRRATNNDLPLLIELMRDFNAHEGICFDEVIARSAIAGMLNDENKGYLWLIERDGLVVGYTVLTFGYSLEFHGRDAFVDEIYLIESARGQGIGQLAIQFLEEQCRSLGISALHLEVERSNTHAQAVYRKAGFVDHDRYLLTKWLI
ncbi:MAG TPA: GNAT family N-acetyltransferase [Blastocatellia bacterium]|nr:GNAT family N-acetyltransferase [Blastocatellia bacterium]